MATIRKRGLKWQVQIRRKGCVAISKSFVAKEDAAKWAREQERRLDRGELSDQGSASCLVAKLLDRYEKEVSPRKRSGSDTFHLRQIGRHPIAKLSIPELSSEAVARFREDRLKCVAPSTVRKEMALLGQVLKHAHAEWGVPMDVNPVALVRKPPSSKGRERRISEDELQALETAFAKCRNAIVRDAFRFALSTGLRRGEILVLQWKHVNLEKSIAFLPITKNGESRSVPLAPAATDTLRRLQSLTKGEKVFPITPNALRLAWERVKRRAGIKDLHFHDLRHEAISRFFEMGLSIPEVSLISGHKDARMLFRYTHLKATDLAQKMWKKLPTDRKDM